MKIIFKIKEIRFAKKITIEELNRATGISVSHINNIENNIKQPTIAVLVLLKKALGVASVEDLYEIKW